MTIAEKQRRLTETLEAFKTAQDRLAYAVRIGRAAEPLPAACRTDANRVEGCLARVWFVPEWREGCCHFRVDSDSAIIKGVAVLLCEFYGGQTPLEIVETSPAFLEKLGITQHLTPNRRNSLGAIWQSMRKFAEIHASI